MARSKSPDAEMESQTEWHLLEGVNNARAFRTLQKVFKTVRALWVDEVFSQALTGLELLCLRER